MSSFLLMHGAWHGAWCWEKVVPLLEGAGHEVAAPDLPGHGGDRTPAAGATLKGYAERVVEALDGMPGPVVLVGHSAGGLAISEAAERRPDKVGLLVYLTAFLLPNGGTLLGAAQTDEESIIPRSTDVDEGRGVTTVRREGAKDLFYGDCPDEDAERAGARLVPESSGIFATPVGLSEGNFGRVRRAYVECLRDRAIGPAAQKRMYTEVACEEVVSMRTDHSLFLSAPEELVGHLDSLARLRGGPEEGDGRIEGG